MQDHSIFQRRYRLGGGDHIDKNRFSTKHPPESFVIRLVYSARYIVHAPSFERSFASSTSPPAGGVQST